MKKERQRVRRWYTVTCDEQHELLDQMTDSCTVFYESLTPSRSLVLIDLGASIDSTGGLSGNA